MASPTDLYTQPSIEISLRERLEQLNLKQTLSTSKNHVIERWQGMTDNSHVSSDKVTSWMTSLFKRRPLTCVFLGAVVMSSWLPLLLLTLFMACVFTVVFFSFVVFESCLIGAGLVVLLLFLTVPLCFSLSASLCLLLLHWCFAVLQEHVRDVVEYLKAVVIFYGTLYVPKTMRRAIGL